MKTRAGKILESLNKRRKRITFKESKSVSYEDFGLEEAKEFGSIIPEDKVEELIEPSKILKELKLAIKNGMELIVYDSDYNKANGVPVDSKGRILLNQGTLYLKDKSDDYWTVGFPKPLKNHVVALEDAPSYKAYTTHVPYGSTTASWEDSELTTPESKFLDNYDLFLFDQPWESASCIECSDLKGGKIMSRTDVKSATEYDYDGWTEKLELDFDINKPNQPTVYMW